MLPRWKLWFIQYISCSKNTWLLKRCLSSFPQHLQSVVSLKFLVGKQKQEIFKSSMIFHLLILRVRRIFNQTNYNSLGNIFLYYLLRLKVSPWNYPTLKKINANIWINLQYSLRNWLLMKHPLLTQSLESLRFLSCQENLLIGITHCHFHTYPTDLFLHLLKLSVECE